MTKTKARPPRTPRTPAVLTSHRKERTPKGKGKAAIESAGAGGPEPSAAQAPTLKRGQACPVCGAMHLAIPTYLKKHASSPYTAPASIAFLKTHCEALGLPGPGAVSPEAQ